MSLEIGSTVFRSEKKVLLCGITGRLLPNFVYSQNLFKFDDLKTGQYIPGIMQESHEIPLSNLDLKKIENRKKYNFTDETIEIVGTKSDSVEILYANCQLLLSKGKDSQLYADVYMDNKSLDWLTPQQTISMSEPFGFPSFTEEQALNLLCNSLKQRGAVVDRYTFDSDGTIQITLSSIADELYRFYISNKSFTTWIGAMEMPAIPLYRWTVDNGSKKTNLLNGHTLYLMAKTDSSFEGDVFVLRTIEDAKDKFFRMDAYNRGQFDNNVCNFVKQEIKKNGISIEKATSLMRLSDDRLLNFQKEKQL
jgi:hypothetical protein